MSPPRPPSPLLASAGNLRVELLNQSSLDPLRYDDGPYEAGGEKDQDPSLIPVPANSYFGTGTAESGRGGTARHGGHPLHHHHRCRGTPLAPPPGSSLPWPRCPP